MPSIINVGPNLAEKLDTNGEPCYKSYLTDEIQTSFSFTTVDRGTVLKVIQALKPKSSCGYDDISMKTIKYIAPALLESLTLIINQSLVTGIFPDKLKIAKVIPLHKKDDEKVLDNYRPISLLPAISKIFERIIFNQVFTYFSKNNLFYPNQYGFRTGHSTEFAALEVIDRIILDMDQGEIPLTIFLDLSKAFDTLNHDILITKLKHYGLDRSSLSLIHSYLSHRKQFVQMDDIKSDCDIITTGVPQGSILGPLLFIIYMNDIANSSKVFESVLYADDTTLMSSLHACNIRDMGGEIINNELKKVHDWLSVNRLSLNVKKTKFMVFHKPQRNIKNCVPHITMNDISVERVAEFNFLGLNINEHLTWSTHASKIGNKISSSIGIINKLKHFLPQHILKTMYSSLVLSQLNYSILAWGFESSRIFKLQKKAVHIISNSKYNAHTEPIFKTLRLLKVEDIFKLQILKFYYKHQKCSLPDYFQSMEYNTISKLHNYSTRQQTHIKINKTKTKFAENCIRNHLAVILNNMPKVILEKSETHSLQGYSNYCKLHFIETYSTECLIRQCYICQRCQ